MSDSTKLPPADWLRDIAESEAQLAAGQVVSAESVLQELRDDIARLEAKLNGNPRRAAAQHR